MLAALIGHLAGAGWRGAVLTRFLDAGDRSGLGALVPGFLSGFGIAALMARRAVTAAAPVAMAFAVAAVVVIAVFFHRFGRRRRTGPGDALADQFLDFGDGPAVG